MAELPRLVDREFDDLLRARRERDLARRGRGIAAADRELHGRAHLRELDPERVEHARGNALTFADEAQEQMLCADVVVVEPDRFVLRESENALCAVVAP